MGSAGFADASVLVPLRVIDVDSLEETHAFPRLDDFKLESDYTSLQIKEIDGSGGTSLVQASASASDTVADIKRRTVPKARSIELVMVELAGETLDNRRTLSECGIISESEVSVLSRADNVSRDVVSPDATDERKGVSPLSMETIDKSPGDDNEQTSGSRRVDIPPEADIRGFLNKACAQALYDWNGVTSDGQSLGLRLHMQEPVMVGRVVNKDWYEGYLPHDLDRCGYIPRNYVEIESLYDEDFRGELDSNDQRRLKRPMASSPLPPRRRWRFLDRFLQSVKGVFKTKGHMNRGQMPPFGTSLTHQRTPPPLPPSPFPPKSPVPNFDLLVRGNRVRLKFDLERDDREEHPTVQVVLSLVSAPQARISYATVELEFEHDTIVDLEPQRQDGAGTEVHHSTGAAHEISATGGVNYGPAELLNLTAKRTESKVAEYSRITRGTVVGDGKGSSKAYWVFKEDSGEAARFGLDSKQKMSVTLHARPVRVDYQVNVKVVMDDGGTGGWFNTKRLSSGRQRYYFIS